MLELVEVAVDVGVLVGGPASSTVIVQPLMNPISILYPVLAAGSEKTIETPLVPPSLILRSFSEPLTHPPSLSTLVGGELSLLLNTT